MTPHPRYRALSVTLRGLFLLSMILSPLMVSSPTYASVQPPDSGPYIISYYAYEGAYTANDTYILLEYNIPYGTLPSASAGVNYFVRYLNASGTVLGVTTPYPYEQLGYNYGAAVLYFAPGVVTWGESGYIQIVGNPTVSWNGTIPSTQYPMMAGNWISSNATAQARAQICSYVIQTLAVDLENRWNVPLTAQASGGTVLNQTYGQQYFSNVIPYFTTVCSAILTTTGAQPVYPPSPTTWANVPVTTYTTGTATFTSGIGLVTGAGTAWTVNMTGQFIKSSLDNEWFKIIDVADANDLTIAITYPFDTEVGTTYQIATMPYQVGLGYTWQGSVVGPDIEKASTGMGMSTQMWLLMSFLVVMFFTLSYAAVMLGGATAIPLVAIPPFVGGIKIGVVPMDIGVSICAVLFIVSMFLLIHRRAAV